MAGMRGASRRSLRWLGPTVAGVVVSASLFLPAPAIDLRDGRSVMMEVERRARCDRQYSEGLVTVQEKGEVRKKAWRAWRSGWGAGAKTLVQFLEPPEVKGVGLLTLSHADRPDEQWFYAPAIDRDRRIAKQEKSTRFLGTHFTFEDMEERDIDDYEYALVGEETIDGVASYRVEARPLPRKDSQYTKLVFSVLGERFVLVRIEAFVGNEARRTFAGSDLREIDGVLSPLRWEVVDSKRGGKTVLELRNVRRTITVDPSLMTVQGMRTLHPPPR
jgi:hypothetical protein